jgi:hypothetical protein
MRSMRKTKNVIDITSFFGMDADRLDARQPTLRPSCPKTHALSMSFD